MQIYFIGNASEWMPATTTKVCGQKESSKSPSVPHDAFTAISIMQPLFRPIGS